MLQKIEEIFIRTSQGCGDDYLAILVRIVHAGGQKEALNYLKTVRLALARYIARCAVFGGEKRAG